MVDLLFRELKREDMDVICTFPQSMDELFYMSPRSAYPPTPEDLWQKASERRFPTVVYEAESGSVVAYANLYDWNEEDASCWLGNVVVAPGSRGGGGAAAFLLESMIEQARVKLGAKRLRLYCHNPNTRAMLFYIKHGFAPNGGYKIVEHPHAHRVVVFEMEKSLAEG
ncbi:GNAT family N-acetyltransferase [Cohnella candidum]|uniref:GNAT family N-acetyltransferase n=1 Tax=Cohnella candidum TaxID=2674991 RepID=A0A3G3JX58_9BACL|nr:GNAT family N-acetyltransferase [Cohnella candidum]AYQ72089.1 GNAT family N-acetyltransferase [Cohnella candidum]